MLNEWMPTCLWPLQDSSRLPLIGAFLLGIAVVEMIKQSVSIAKHMNVVYLQPKTIVHQPKSRSVFHTTTPDHRCCGQRQKSHQLF